MNEISSGGVEADMPDLAALERSIQAAQAARADDIAQKHGELGKLQEESHKNEELLMQAQEAAAYFERLEQTGNFPEIQRPQYDDLKRTIATLEARRAEIATRTNELAGMREVGVEAVQAASYDEASKENIERTKEKMIRDARERFDPQIVALARDLREFSHHARQEREAAQAQLAKVRDVWNKIAKVAQEAIEKLDVKSDLHGFLRKDFQEPKSAQGLQQLLQAKKGALGGWFKGKERGAIEAILSHKEYFSDLEAQELALKIAEENSQREEKEESIFPERFKQIILEAWEMQRKINALTGMPYSSDIPSEVRLYLEDQFNILANLQRTERKENKVEQVGRYKDLNEAAHNDPSLRTFGLLNNLMQERAGGLDLIYNDPKRKEQV